MRIHRIPAWLADTNCWVIATDDARPSWSMPHRTRIGSVAISPTSASQ